MKFILLNIRLGLAYLKLGLLLYMLFCTGLQSYQWYQTVNQTWQRITTAQQAIAHPLSFLPWNSPND